MIWTRRAFLQVVCGGVAGVVALRSVPLPEFYQPSPDLSTAGIRIYDFFVVSPTDELVIGRISRPNGPVLLLFGMAGGAGYGGAGYRWVAAPGSEIIGPVVNDSDARLRLTSMQFEYDGRRYAYSDLHGVQPLDATRGARARRRAAWLVGA